MSTSDIEFSRKTSNTKITHYITKINPFRILVVDDDSFILDLFRQVLSRIKMNSDFELKILRLNEDFSRQNTPNLPSSFEIVPCQQAGEAVDAVKDSLKYGHPFSIAFVDVRMPPGPDGVWAAEQIRALDPNIEIVIMTGYKDISPDVIAHRVPPAHKLLYIQKPFQSYEIIQFAIALSMKWDANYRLQEVHKELEACVEEQIRELKKVAKKFDEIIKSIADYMIMIDETYRIVWANHSINKVFGENILGKKCHKFYYKREEPCPQCIVRKTFAEGRVYEQHKEFVEKNGNKMIFWCTSNVAEIYEDGRPKTVLIILRDITEVKHIEKKLRESRDKAVSGYKSKSKSLSDTLKMLEEKEKDLKRYKSDLEKLNKEMIENNHAVSVLARNINRNKELYENKIYEMATAKIIPIIKELKNNKNCQKIMADLEVLETHVNSLYSVSDNHNEIINILTDQEMRVATLIKRGLTSQKISNMLYISEDTVKTHRKNIRKKLKIQNSNINLVSYLKSIMPSDFIRESQAPFHGPDLKRIENCI